MVCATCENLDNDTFGLGLLHRPMAGEQVDRYFAPVTIVSQRVGLIFIESGAEERNQFVHRRSELSTGPVTPYLARNQANTSMRVRVLPSIRIMRSSYPLAAGWSLVIQSNNAAFGFGGEHRLDRSLHPRIPTTLRHIMPLRRTGIGVP